MSNGENSEPDVNTQGTNMGTVGGSEAPANTQGTSISNGDDSETTFTKAETDIKTQIDKYIHDSEAQKDIKEVDITSILNGFSYENEETTGSAVSIKAKDISNFENDGNTLSFEGTLYEAKEGGNTYNFNYSNTYKSAASMLSASLLTSSGDSSWSTGVDIKTVSSNIVTINGVEFMLTDSTNKHVSVFGLTDDITSDLILPDTITCGSTSYSVTSIVIGMYTYGATIKLANIKIPRTVTSIRENSLRDFSKLTNINVDEDNKNYASKDGVLFNKNLTVLLECPGGKEVDKYIVPSSVTSIGNEAFYGCSKLTSINVNKENKNYVSEDGVLFNKSLALLIKYPEAKEVDKYIIPSSVTSIGNEAFYGCSKLTSVEIPSSVTSIGSFAISYCSNLTSVEIPSSVISIGDGSFYGCSKLTSIEIPINTIIGDGVFQQCDKDLTALRYEVSDSVIKITGIYQLYPYKTYIGPNITIPDTICGIKVTEIAEGLFDNYTDRIQSITCYNPDIREQLRKSNALEGKVKAIIDANSISGDTIVTYDGKAHSIKVKGAPEGTTITYSTTEGGNYTVDNPEYTEAGEYTVYYKVSGEGYEDLMESASLKIVKNPVNSIVISTEGGANAISAKGGSLKVNGAVSPSDAWIPALKWTIVSGQDLGSISEAGTLTANGTKNGVIKVHAEATDGSGVVSNELTINIENQVPSSSGGDSLSGNSSGNGSSASSKHNTTTEVGENTNIEEQKPKANGLNLIDGKWYIVLEDGSYAKGWYKDAAGNWYMLNSNTGEMVTGWFKDVNNLWYYLDLKSGKMLIGWLQDTDGKWYHLNTVGAMSTDWEQTNGNWYYFDNSGAMLTGWIKYTDGKWYYLYPDGSMASNTVVDGYTLGPDGALS